MEGVYEQITLEVESDELVTINTVKRLFQFTRLPFSVVSAPASSEREMDNLQDDLPHVTACFDDILATGRNDEDHWRNVSKVLNSLQDTCLHLKLAKCEFTKDRPKYLGHVITV